MNLKLVRLGMYMKVISYFQIFRSLSSDPGAFGKREKAEETRWTRRHVRIYSKNGNK
jgi:hypothetical protein